jgi:site-specific DNA recombinase
MGRVFAYLRVSSIGQVNDGAGLDAQTDACQAWAALHGVEIAETFTDAAVSGAKPIAERPGLMSALAALDTGDILLVYKRDRIARDTMTALVIDDQVARRGARIVSTQGEASDDDTPTGKFVRTVLDAVAELERAMIKARLNAGRAAKKRRGLKTTRVIPYGFRVGADRKTLEPEPAEQAVLGDIMGLRASGMTLREIQAALSERGVLARGGKPFTVSTLGVIVKRHSA